MIIYECIFYGIMFSHDLNCLVSSSLNMPKYIRKKRGMQSSWKIDKVALIEIIC